MVCRSRFARATALVPPIEVGSYHPSHRSPRIETPALPGSLSGCGERAHSSLDGPSIARHATVQRLARGGHLHLELGDFAELAVEAAAQTEAQALLILLADMPFVRASHIAALIAACDGEIVASSDGIQSMPPAIFPRDSWSRLLDTEGDAGARHILTCAHTLAAPEGSLRDIDTPDDLAASKAPPLGLDRST